CHSGQATIELFNLMGKSVLQNEVEIESGFNRIRLETASVRPGIFMLKFSSGKDEQFRKISILR
ncbi:MAG: T9SS type A sorting domain-containing protein, partial [Bacteroidales bacterium]|nr:T9SS type A sorting domain-containing protein [Bacteroidales bacterium]